MTEKMGAEDGTEASPKPGSFAFVVQNMLPQKANPRLVRYVARQCCKQCGLPPGCTCHKDVLQTTTWSLWPDIIIEFLVAIVARLIKRLKLRELKRSQQRLVMA